MNKERRDKFKNWFTKALLPCRSASGVVRYIGTILHSDSLLENLMPKHYDKKTVVEPLKTWSKRNNKWKAVKYRAHSDDFTSILWPERWPKEKLQDERQMNIELGKPENYSQEFLNIPIDESFSYFKRADFLAETKEDKDKVLNYYITADLAVSKDDTADYSVFVIAGVDENRRIFIKDVIRERLDGLEIVETVLNLERAYHPEVFGIEEMQVSKAIGPFLREEMIRQNTFPNITQLKHGGKDKIARAKSIQGRLRAHTIRFAKDGEWYPDFEDELCTFPRGKHDDQVDSFAYLGLLLDKVLEAPTLTEIEEEQYLDDLHEYESDNGNSGRSQHTGY